MNRQVIHLSGAVLVVVGIGAWCPAALVAYDLTTPSPAAPHAVSADASIGHDGRAVYELKLRELEQRRNAAAMTGDIDTVFAVQEEIRALRVGGAAPRHPDERAQRAQQRDFQRQQDAQRRRERREQAARQHEQRRQQEAQQRMKRQQRDAAARAEHRRVREAARAPATPVALKTSTPVRAVPASVPKPSTAISAACPTCPPAVPAPRPATPAPQPRRIPRAHARPVETHVSGPGAKTIERRIIRERRQEQALRENPSTS